MRKTYKDFKNLETMSVQDLRDTIEITKIEYDNYLSYIKEYEEMLEEEAKLNGTPKFAIAYPRVDLITNNLANLESYIRKAENILNEYEPTKQLLKIKKARRLHFGVIECFAEELEQPSEPELPKPKIGLNLNRKSKRLKF